MRARTKRDLVDELPHGVDGAQHLAAVLLACDCEDCHAVAMALVTGATLRRMTNENKKRKIAASQAGGEAR